MKKGKQNLGGNNIRTEQMKETDIETYSPNVILHNIY
jgi:hypothetical protein